MMKQIWNRNHCLLPKIDLFVSSIMFQNAMPLVTLPFILKVKWYNCPPSWTQSLQQLRISFWLLGPFDSLILYDLNFIRNIFDMLKLKIGSISGLTKLHFLGDVFEFFAIFYLSIYSIFCSVIYFINYFSFFSRISLFNFL